MALSAAERARHDDLRAERDEIRRRLRRLGLAPSRQMPISLEPDDWGKLLDLAEKSTA